MSFNDPGSDIKNQAIFNEERFSFFSGLHHTCNVQTMATLIMISGAVISTL